MLESVISQETTFNFEFIVADDGSSDKTRDIINEYAERYPEIIKPIFREKNMGAWSNFIDALRQAKGDYIALCEGDDYWIDNEKLQKQVDFLDKNPDYVICFHKARVVYEGDEKEETYPDVEDPDWYNLKELLSINYIPTASVMYRKQDYSALAPEMMPGDWYLHVYHAKFGKIKIINDVMSVYRKHKNGIWWDYDANRDRIWRKYGLSYMRLYTSFLDMIKDMPAEYSDIVKTEIFNLLMNIARVDKKFDDDRLNEALNEYPSYSLPFMYFASESYERKSVESDNYRDELLKVGDERATLRLELAKEQQELETLRHELSVIKKSVSWKILKAGSSAYKKVKRKK